MRILIYILLLLLLTACGSSESPTYINSPAQPQPEPDPPAVVHNLIVSDGTDIYTSDGTDLFLFGTGQAANAQDGFISIDDILYGIDDTGSETISQRLVTTPSAIAIGADTWIFENIDAATAYSMGGMYKNYVRIYQNSDIYSEWYLNQWEVVDAFITESGDVIAIDTVGKLRNIKNQSLAVSYARHNGLMIHSTDVNTHRSTISTVDGDFRVAYQYNYFFGANQWLWSDDTVLWYSWNGYTFDGLDLHEMETSLQSFISTSGAAPVVVAAGTRVEHSETVLYWIECNDGWLYRYTPSLDRVEQVARLYMGDGDRLYGVNCAKVIKPILADGALFFTWSGSVWKYDFNSGSVSSFVTGAEVWGM
jgi:hypothetical protein